jgi:hypothetical protein
MESSPPPIQVINDCTGRGVTTAVAAGRSCGDCAIATRIDPFSLDRLLRFL